MDLITLIVVIVVVGIALWAINAYVPMEPRIKQLLNIVVIAAVFIYALVFLLGLGGVDLRGF